MGAFSEPRFVFLNIPIDIMDRCSVPNSLSVGDFKNSCRLTDVDLNNLRTINQDFLILNSILLFKTKNLEHACAQV
jgi:hypothetical protein